MIIVIMVVMLMTLIPLAMFTQAVQQLPLARHDQDHESALAAAEAGVDDYLNHLAQNSNYWTYNAEQPRRPAANPRRSPRCGRPVPGPSRPTASTSATTPNTTKTRGDRHRVPHVVRAGRATSIRTVKVGLRRQGFLDYLWLTDYEITDPVAVRANASNCKFHAWEWNSAHQQVRARRRRRLQRRVLDRPGAC